MNSRELPNALEQEKKLLSALMLKDGKAIEDIEPILKPSDFYREEHRCIYRAMLTLYSQGTPPHVLLIEEELRRTDELKKVKREYLFALLDYEFTTTRAKKYAATIKEKAQRRKLVELGEELEEYAADEIKDVEELIATTETRLLKAAGEDTESTRDIQTVLWEAFREAKERRKTAGEITGVTTGMIALDKVTGGLKKSDLIILAARPSMGKTALALNIAVNAARKIPVAVFSLEMSTGQLGQRMLSLLSDVELSKIATGDMTDDEENQMLAGAVELDKATFFIDDRTQTLAGLKMRARLLKRKHKIGLLVIDYIQLIIGDKTYKGNRVQEVSDISRQLKALAKELDIPILALSQLNRGAEVRADKRPLLSDLRESGSIEQDADIVMFIYRDAYYNEDSAAKNIAEINVAKNRNGATGRCNLSFDGNKCRFRDLTREVS